MSEESQKILTTVDQVLAGRELQDQARALLLFRLCQFALLLNPEKAEKYWGMLQACVNKIPADLQTDLTSLRTTFEETSSAGAKGFTAEMLALVKAAQALDDPEETKNKLLEVETQLKKRFLPFGKGPVWAALVEAWVPLDRLYALQLLKNVSGGLQENFIIKLNKAALLSPEEWAGAAQSVGMGKAESIALKILEDENQDLSLPKDLLYRLAASLRNGLNQAGLAGNENEMVKKFNLYKRLLLLHTNSDQAVEIPGLLEEFYKLVVTTNALDQNWPTRFSLVTGVMVTGSQLGLQGLEVLTEAFAQRLAGKTPAHMLNFLWAAWSAQVAVLGEAESAYNSLMKRVNGDPNAEAWFFIVLVERGFGMEALELAAKLPRAQSLLPRLRRAWLCTYPETAMQSIRPEEMADDPIGEFLLQGSPANRAAFLKKLTQNGLSSLPEATWAGGGKTSAFDFMGYLKRNPVYSSFTKITKPEEQFSENLRLNGYGEYKYSQLDTALLAALVAWGDEEPLQAQNVMRGMWNSIRPEDFILQIDWLRGAVLSRCVTIFSAEPKVFISDFLNWLETELVKKGRQWQFGNQIMTLRFPPTVLLSFAISAAATVGSLSADRKDRILVSALEKAEATPELVDTAAQVYNSGKPVLALAPPVKLKSHLLPAWQTGIVKNAVPAIFQAMLAEAQEKAAGSAPA